MAQIRIKLGPHSFGITAESLDEGQRIVDDAIDGDGWIEATDVVGGNVRVRLCAGVPLWIEDAAEFPHAA